MNLAKQKRLQAAGWKVGTTAEFLGLSTNESLLIEVKLALAFAVRTWRRKLGLTQAQLGKRMRSSQSRSRSWKPATARSRSICSSMRSQASASPASNWLACSARPLHESPGTSA